MSEKNPIKQTREIYEAVKSGQLPTNEQARQMLETLNEDVIHQAAREAHVSKSGRELLYKTEKAVDLTSRVLQEKNQDNQIQELLYHTRMASEKLKRISYYLLVAHLVKVGEKAKEQTEGEIKEDLSRVFEDLTRIVILFSRSYEFRRVLGNLNKAFYQFLDLFTQQLPRLAENLTESLKSVTEETSSTKTQQSQKTETDKGKEKEREEEENLSERFNKQMSLAEETVSEAEKPFMTALNEEQISGFLVQLKDAFLQVVKSEEYKRTIQDLFSILGSLYETLTVTAEQALHMKIPREIENEDQKQKRLGLEQLEKAKSNIRSLLENMAGGHSLQPLIQQWQALNEKLAHDKRATQYLKEWSQFFKKILVNPEYLEKEEYQKEGSRLIETSSNYLMTHFYANFIALNQELTTFLSKVANDKLLNDFSNQWGDLFLSLFLNEYGMPTFKPELIFDAGKVLLYLLERIKTVPLEPISHYDADYDYEIDHVFLKTEKMIPNILETLFRTKAPRMFDSVTEKKSMPKMQDSGLLDLNMDQEGMTIVIELIPEPWSQKHLYRVASVETKIQNLDLKIHESHHQVLYTLLHPWVKKNVRERLESEVSEKLREMLVDLNDNLFNLIQVSNELYRSKQSAGQPARLPVWGSPAFTLPE